MNYDVIGGIVTFSELLDPSVLMGPPGA